jgi:ADP-ribosylglycohydrolase
VTAAEPMLERACGALWGLAVGDALGMPTQSLPRALIASTWGLLDGFEAGPSFQPIAPGLPAGTVTDDTEQAVLLARELITGQGRVDGARFADALIDWERLMRARGSLDLLGPSTRRAIEALRGGVPIDRTGRDGTTNGAAMRITPVGIAVDGADPEALIRSVVEASRLTHNTQVALAGAAAVAAAVSAGVGGALLDDALGQGADAAGRAVLHGRWVAAGDVAARIRWAMRLTRGRDAGPDGADAALEDVYRLVGTGLATQESVPAAFAVLALTPDDPWLACRRAASLGGDTDTIAAMVGAIAGACAGISAFPADAVRTVRQRNRLDLDPLARQLLGLRRARR